MYEWKLNTSAIYLDVSKHLECIDLIFQMFPFVSGNLKYCTYWYLFRSLTCENMQRVTVYIPFSDLITSHVIKCGHGSWSGKPNVNRP